MAVGFQVLDAGAQAMNWSISRLQAGDRRAPPVPTQQSSDLTNGVWSMSSRSLSEHHGSHSVVTTTHGGSLLLTSFHEAISVPYRSVCVRFQTLRCQVTQGFQYKVSRVGEAHAMCSIRPELYEGLRHVGSEFGSRRGFQEVIGSIPRVQIILINHLRPFKCVHVADS